MLNICAVSLQYDFPKQEAVIQFVIDAIQAEAFNPKTLFLIGSYTIGKVQYISFWIFMLRTLQWYWWSLPFNVCLKYVVIWKIVWSVGLVSCVSIVVLPNYQESNEKKLKRFSMRFPLLFIFLYRKRKAILGGCSFAS